MPILRVEQGWGALRRLRGAAQEVRAAYGDDENNFYAADTFNEMDPGTNDPAYLRNASSAVYNVCGLAPRSILYSIVGLSSPAVQAVSAANCFCAAVLTCVCEDLQKVRGFPATEPIIKSNMLCMMSKCSNEICNWHAKQAMAAGDPGARWIMQAWLFYNEKDFWQKPQIQVRRQVTSRRH